MAGQRTFVDLNWNLEIHPKTKDVMKVYDANAVIASVKHLVLTEFYGRPHHPEIGTGVAGALFEPWSPVISKAIELTIEDVIGNHEPRASISGIDVRFDPGNKTYLVTISLYLNAMMQEITVDIILEKAR